MLGSELLVAPLFENGKTRSVYLPKGKWTDYQTGKIYGSGWHEIAAGNLDVVIMVREGAVLPHVGVAQSTGDIDWSHITLAIYGGGATASVQLFLPGQEQVKEVVLTKKGRKYVVNTDPFGGKIQWEIR